jgi:hypothetical protein
MFKLFEKKSTNSPSAILSKSLFEYVLGNIPFSCLLLFFSRDMNALSII